MTRSIDHTDTVSVLQTQNSKASLENSSLQQLTKTMKVSKASQNNKELCRKGRSNADIK